MSGKKTEPETNDENDDDEKPSEAIDLHTLKVRPVSRISNSVPCLRLPRILVAVLGPMPGTRKSS